MLVFQMIFQSKKAFKKISELNSRNIHFFFFYQKSSSLEHISKFKVSTLTHSLVFICFFTFYLYYRFTLFIVKKSIKISFLCTQPLNFHSKTLISQKTTQFLTPFSISLLSVPIPFSKSSLLQRNSSFHINKLLIIKLRLIHRFTYHLPKSHSLYFFINATSSNSKVIIL